MVYVYDFTMYLTDIQQLYTYLSEAIVEVKSVTCECDGQETPNEMVEVHVHTDNQLSEELETTLNNAITNYTNPKCNPLINSFRNISIKNSTRIPLYPSDTFQGRWEDISSYSTATIIVSCDQDSAVDGLQLSFSMDGETVDQVRSLTVDKIVGSVNQITVVMRYFKLEFTNNNSLFNNVRIQCIYHHFRNKAISTNLNASIDDTFDCEVIRSVLNGRLQNGQYVPIGTTPDSHLEVALHSPVTSFGELSIAKNSPVLQHDFVYNIDDNNFQKYTQNNGTVTQADGMAICASGNNSYSTSTLRSRRVIRYKPGQGAKILYTALFGTPQTGNSQVAGIGTPETSLMFGYLNTTFGLYYVPRNARQVHTIEITTKSSDSQNVTIILGGVSYSVPVTNSANTTSTAWEISKFDYTTSFPGWVMSANGSTIKAACIQAGVISGAFSVSFPTSGSATITKDWDGDASYTQFIPQTSWNIDVMDGSLSNSNPNGQLLDPLKGNIFYIMFQYLGYGYVEFGIEDPFSSELQPVHRIRYTNQNVLPNMKNPTFPFILASRNTTCTTAVTVKSSSVAGFIQGDIKHLESTNSYTARKSGVTTSLTHIFTLRSNLIVDNKFNLKLINVDSISVSNYGSNFVEMFLYRYTILDNNASFSSVPNTYGVHVDTSANVSGGKIEYSFGLCPGQSIERLLKDLNIITEQNMCFSILAKTASSTTDVSVSLTFHEE